MSLIEKISEDIATAMKESNTSRVAVLRLMKNALKNEQIKIGHELSDDEALKVLQREAKQRRDSISAYESAGRNDLAQSEKGEMEVISQYLPAQLCDEELEKVVDQVIAEVGASGPNDTGAVMGKAMAAVKGQADGARVSAAVRKKLT